MEPLDVALLIMRVWLGIVIAAHGLNHATSLDGTTRWFAKIGWRNARLQATLSAVAELAIGAALIAGFLTTLAASGLVATMFVAFLSVHRSNGFFIFRPGEGWEYVATLAVGGLVVATLGGGAYSIDAVLGITALSGWVGLLIGLGGFVLGAVQTATFWRRPAGS